MIPVDQVNATGDEGDCLMACVASILELSLDALPSITIENEAKWYDILSAALFHRGFAVAELWGDHDPMRPWIAPHGYTIAIGPSPRHSPEHNEAPQYHACVALDGVIVHDPHPTRTGLRSIFYWLMLVPILHAPRVLAPYSQEMAFDL